VLNLPETNLMGKILPEFGLTGHICDLLTNRYRAMLRTSQSVESTGMSAVNDEPSYRTTAPVPRNHSCSELPHITKKEPDRSGSLT
jgi:hypothetical protein